MLGKTGVVRPKSGAMEEATHKGIIKAKQEAKKKHSKGKGKRQES